ncbi:endoribonuclease MazF [Extensimonas vulgaris]|nr:endoribonuclease MazF [Extensimonas vulgaris]
MAQAIDPPMDEAREMGLYVPDAGDIVWLLFDPQAGHEQAGHRPALVLSPASYNARAGLMLCCPMTTQIKGYPFEVLIAGAKPSAALADQVKSVDWRARKATRKGKVTATELSQVRRKAIALIGKP